MVARRFTLLIVGVIAVGALAAAVAALPELNGTSQTTTGLQLPAGCVKPADGFLIVASLQGFNDSIGHGVPNNNWPVMNVKLGQNVTIVVCNADSTQAHGFQITHYYDSRLVSIAPGQVIRVSFVATAPGSFRVYCQILCTVHWAMQNGQLIVS